MTAPSATTSRRLADLDASAWWARGTGWSHLWWTEAYCPLLAEGVFLPPLLAYDLVSSSERGDRGRGRTAATRGDSEAWTSFMLWAQRCILGSLRPADAAHEQARRASAMRLCRLVAQTLMYKLAERADLSELRGSGGAFDPERVLIREVAHLAGKADRLLESIWGLVKDAVVAEDPSATSASRFDGLVSVADSLPFAGKATDDLDPFIPMLLGSGTPDGSGMMLEVPAMTPGASTPRTALGAAGPFAKRDLGGLPSQTARLAPTELMLLRAGGGGRDATTPAGAAADSRSSAFRTLFLYRAARGELLQRFSRTLRSSWMQPSVLVQIELVDQPELHRLWDPPAEPVISWYRAVAIQVAHGLSRIAEEERWSASLELGTLGSTPSRRRFPESTSRAMARSPSAAFEVLASALPDAFAARTGLRSATQPTPPTVSVDLWLRLFLGARQQRDMAATQRVRAGVSRGVRIERLRNGLYGARTASEASDVHRLDGLEFDRPAAAPGPVAAELISALLELAPSAAEEPFDAEIRL